MVPGVEKTEHNAERHLDDAQNDGHLHLVRVGERQLVLCNVPQLPQRELRHITTKSGIASHSFVTTEAFHAYHELCINYHSEFHALHRAHSFKDSLQPAIPFKQTGSMPSTYAYEKLFMELLLGGTSCTLVSAPPPVLFIGGGMCQLSHVSNAKATRE